jgi:hypothetical protein|tara:strand:+ start:62 stop:271 length:210 start_codon:yes stop_codon:yes gene_type:complete
MIDINDHVVEIEGKKYVPLSMLKIFNNLVENPVTKEIRLKHEQDMMITDKKPLDPNRRKNNDDIIVGGM